VPSLHEALRLVAEVAEQHGIRIADEILVDLEKVVRQAWPGQRVHIPPNDSRKDPARAEAIRRAAASLPTGVVAERYGISRAGVWRVKVRK
jgi:DNA-binding transcriptional regulator LsrR (DeoR family)